MILAHKIALDTTVKQRRYFSCAAGCDRFVWNIALEEWNRAYAGGEKPNGMKLKKEFNKHKYEKYPWLVNVHRDAHADPFDRLQKAWNTYFKALKKGDKKAGRPKFHKKGRKESFYVANEQVKIRDTGWSVKLPLIGKIRLREKLRHDGRIMGAVVSRTSDRWFISVQVDVGEVNKKRTANGIVGVDLGIKNAVTLSSGEQFEAPKPLKKALCKLKRYQRKSSRQVNKSKNQKKMYCRVAKVHARVFNIRKDFWHKITTKICRENQAVAVEDLNIRGMVKNRKLSRALVDVSIGTFKPMLEYKAKLYGTQVFVADRFFPSSKKCSACGYKKETLSLSERIFHCDHCGFDCDRDVNAAINLKNLIPTACGELKPVKDARLVKAISAAGTTMLVTHQQEVHTHV